MKKIIFISFLLMVVAGSFFWNGDEEKIQVAQKMEGGKTLLPFSSKTASVLVPKVTVSEEEIKELKIAREEFTQGLTELKQMTKRYNKKAMKGEVTPEDEKAYRQVEKKSLLAFAQYKKAYIKTISEMEN